MFKDRAFNLSLLFSSAWHLFWISAICVVVTPSVQPSNLYQEVNFLGPLLEKTAFDIMVDAVKPQTETLYARSTLFLSNVYLKPKGPVRRTLKETLPDIQFDSTSFIFGEYGKEEVPTYFDENIRMMYAKPEKSELGVLGGGLSEKREVIFKPEAVTVPRGLYGETETYAVKLRFFVNDKGLVQDVELLASSGYPGIDLKAIGFLKKWRFSPAFREMGEKDKASRKVISISVETK